MRFDSADLVEEVVWDMRLSEQVRAADRTTLLNLYDGFPPFDPATADENNVDINLNTLSGPNLVSMARRQWNNAFLRPSNFFNARPDMGSVNKRMAWATDATRIANRLLKRDRAMVGQVRATGGNTILFGIGPTNWRDRRTVVPKPIPVGSLLIPSETEIDDFDDSVSYFAIFREWTAEQLWDMTHGPRVDPGWNMDLVQSQWAYIKDELRKSPNSIAYQYMPERIEQLNKQDKGYLGSDAVPTCDVWDFYFREAENGKGWYRRIILDWYVGGDVSKYSKSSTRPDSKNKVGDKYGFLYSSGKRKYADSINEILHCQFGDCSAYFPQKYHSIRSLGWMLWGVCDLDNRLYCKFNESVFQQLMWFFQTAGNSDLVRLKRANFEHMGVIPNGIKFLTAAERFVPNSQLMQMAFQRNRQLMSDSATIYTQDYNEGENKDRTATETMAIVNSSQALASSILEMGYTYETFKYREIWRRLCLKNSNDPMAREFRKQCLKSGIPEEMLEADRWNIEPEQVIGGGNKTLQMATVGFLNNIRKNLTPRGQRLVDHISCEVALDQPDLAEEMAPLGENQPISTSMHDAQEATPRLLRALPFVLPKDAIFEDYIKVWLHDLATEIQKGMAGGGMVSPSDLQGLYALANAIGNALVEMGTNEEDREKVREYEDGLGKLMNHVKAFEQRLQQSMKKQAQPQPGGNGQEKAQAAIIMANTKAAIQQRSADQRLQQRNQQFAAEQQRENQRTQAQIVREGVKTRHQLMGERLKALSE